MIKYKRYLIIVFLVFYSFSESKISAKPYENHCWNCGSYISSDFCYRCQDCGWYICNVCYSCYPHCKRSGTISNDNNDNNSEKPVTSISSIFWIFLILLGLPYLLIKFMLFIADKLKQKNDFRNLQQVTKKYYTFPTEKNYSFPEIKITTVDYTKPSSNILISNTKNNDFTLKNKVQVKADLIRKPVKGGKVRHRKFGIGIIEEIDEQKDRIIILFGSQQRVFILSSAIGTYLELLD